MNSNFIIKFCFLLIILHFNINCDFVVVDGGDDVDSDDYGGCNLPNKHCPTFKFIGYLEAT